jgi:hypothetical protein
MECFKNQAPVNPIQPKPWHNASEIQYHDLPEVIQGLIFDFIDMNLPAGSGSPTIPNILPLGIVPVRGLPHVPISIREDGVRGVAYARRMDLDKTPPILIAYGVLIDGRHRIYAAREKRRDSLIAIDLTDYIKQETAEANGMGPVIGFQKILKTP